jgi:predicted transcriptional regulator of viral defense system
MPRFAPDNRPKFDELYDVAATQEGLFTTDQANAVGYSRRLLSHYTTTGKFSRVERGIYRLVHFPPGDHEDLVALWLWSERAGVFSHETALLLQNLSDALPGRVHLTLPPSWQKRRLKVPSLVVLHHAEVSEGERAWVGAVPVTKPARSINDCAAGHVAPDLVAQAIEQGLDRGLFRRAAIAPALAYVEKYGKGG